MLTPIIISITPILAYTILFIWTNWLINSKLTNKDDRKRYKKFFNKRLGTFFAPIFLFSVLLATVLFPKPDTWVTFGIILFALKVVNMFLQGAISYMMFNSIRDSIYKLRHDTVENILNDIEDE